MTTRYEITATKGDKSIRLAFSARRTRSSLANNMHNSAERIETELGTDPKADYVGVSVNGVLLSDGTVIAFSGRTELDCKGK